MSCSSLQEIALMSVSRQLAVAGATEPDDWACGPAAVLAHQVSCCAPLECKLALLSSLARQGTLTKPTLKALWCTEMSILVTQLQLSACCRLTARSLADCLTAAAVAAREPTAYEHGALLTASRDQHCRGNVDEGLSAVKSGSDVEVEGPHAAQDSTPRNATVPDDARILGMKAGGTDGWTAKSARNEFSAGRALAAMETGVLPQVQPLPLPTTRLPPFRPHPSPQPLCVTLRFLGLHGCHKTSDQDVQLLLPYCNRLEALSVSACHQLGNATVAAVGAYLSDCITSLDFSECCLVSDLTPLHTCSRLRSLRLSGCWRLAGWPCPSTLPPGSATLAHPSGATNHTSFVQWRPRAAGGAELQAEEASTDLRQREQWQPQIVDLLRKSRLLQELDLSGIPTLWDEDLRCLWERAEASPGGDSHGVEASTERSVAACSRTLTSLSLSSTSITSQVPPRLAASCPFLAHLRVSYCHAVAGCSVLIAARIRAAQITAAAGANTAGNGTPEAGEAQTYTDMPQRRSPAGLLTSSSSTELEGLGRELNASAAAGIVAAVGTGSASLRQSIPSGKQPEPRQQQQAEEALKGGSEAHRVAAPFKTLCAAGLSQWEEEPEEVLGGDLLGQLAEYAVQGLQGLVAAPAAGAGDEDGGRGGGGHAGSLASRLSGLLSDEALGAAGLVEDLFELQGRNGCGAAMLELTSLDLSGSSQFSDMAAARLASCCCRLTSLSLAGCWRLTDEGLEHLGSLTWLTSLDLTNCNPGPGAHRALRAPGSAFRRPTLADGTSAHRPVETGKQQQVPENGKRPRRGGLTDRGLAVLLAYLTQPQSPPPPPQSSQGHQSVEQQQRLRQTEAPQCQPPSLYSTIEEPMAISIAEPRAWTATASSGGVGRGLRMLRLGGTDVGDAALRSLAGLSRLELPGCKGVSDLGLLQALENCPRLQVLKLSGCKQLSAAALGCSAALTPSAPASGQHRVGQSAAGRVTLRVEGTTAADLAGSCNDSVGSPPRYGAAITGANTRARNLLNISLPGGMSYDAAVRWLFGGAEGPCSTGSPGYGVTGVGAATLGALQSLTLNATPQPPSGGSSVGVTDSLLAYLAGSCPLMRSLRIRNATAATDVGAGAVLRGCRLLRRFALTGALHVTVSTMDLAMQLASAAAVGMGLDVRGKVPLAGGAEESAAGSLLHLDLSGCTAVKYRFLLYPSEALGHRAEATGPNQPPDSAASYSVVPEISEVWPSCPQFGSSRVDNHSSASLPPGLHFPLTAPPPPLPSLLLLSLNLVDCPQVQSRALVALFARSPHLRDLAAALDTAGLRAAASCCPHLRSLRVTAVISMVAGTAAAYQAKLQQQQRGSSLAWVVGKVEWGALVRLEVPEVLRRDASLQSWVPARPWLQVSYM